MSTRREFSDPIVLSALLHYGAVLYLINWDSPQIAPITSPDSVILTELYSQYTTLICSSTTLSLLWHLTRESSQFLYLVDYTFAFLWGLYDIVLAFTVGKFQIPLTVIFLNVVSLYLNQITDKMAYHKLTSYDVSHTVSHVLSVIKSIYVAKILTNSHTNLLDRIHPRLPSL